MHRPSPPGRAALRRGALRLTGRGRRRLALEDAADYGPAQRPGLGRVDAESTVESDGLGIRTYRIGPTDAEVTVVFIHGFTLAAEVYYLQTEFLGEHYPQVRSVLIDARGHGATGAVAPEECTVAGTADDVLAAINEHAPTGELILLGHSLGGLTALNLVKRADAELAARIRGIILVATSIESLSTQGLPQVLASPIADKVRDTVEAAPGDTQRFREYASQFLAPALATAVFRRPTDPEVIRFHAAMIHETPLDTFVGFFDDLQEHEEIDAAPALRDLPGYILVGEVDDVTPMSQAERILELWPRAYLQVAAGAGHMLPLEAPGILNNALAALLDRRPGS